MYRNGKLDSLWSSTLPEIRITSNKASNKSCSKLNFVQKSPRAHMSIFSMSGAWGLQRSVHLKCYSVQKWKSPQLHSWGGQTYVPTDFLVRNSIPKNFYLKLFWMYCVFLAALSPEVNLISHFCTLQDFRYTDLWNSPAPLVREIREIFCTKFNSEQLLFEAFFDVVRIFGISEPQN